MYSTHKIAPCKLLLVPEENGEATEYVLWQELLERRNVDIGLIAIVLIGYMVTPLCLL
jgi:hypothetical protein